MEKNNEKISNIIEREVKMRHGLKKTGKRRAFTIVELLTVMGVIAMLIGLLVPALNLVRTHGKNVKQQAQFNAMKAGLEMFRNDNGDYPKSEQIQTQAPLYADTGANVTTGAQHLAEALLGRDLQGFDPKTTWDAQDDQTANPDAYSPVAGGTPDARKESLDRRKGPYLDLENIGAFNIDKLYPAGGTGLIYGTTPAAIGTPANNTASPFITDVYTDKTITIQFNTANGLVNKFVRAGTPVLYYKANPTNKNLMKNTAGAANFTDRTYNYWDNAILLTLGKMIYETATLPAITDTQRYHPMSDPSGGQYNKFYEIITNPQIANNDGVAYKADTYILMSAGKNGLFGDADDVYNFGN